MKEDLLPFAVQVANKLNQNDRKWKTLSKFWVENLAYVATLCQGHNHAQLLGKGGEFLSHVWILKEHFNHIEVLQSHEQDHKRKKQRLVLGQSQVAVQLAQSLNLVMDRVLVWL